MPATTTRLRAMGRHAAVFGIAGPPAGALCFLVLALLDGPASLAAETLLSARLLVVGAFLLFGAYVLGTVPAVATGIVFVVLSHGRRWNAAVSAAWGAGLGAAATTVCHLAAEVVNGMPSAPPLALPLIGALSGRACALLSRALAPGSTDRG